MGEIRAGISSLFSAPAGYEVILGVGGATAFWDAATFGLVENKAHHLVFGEFGSKFAAATHKAPFVQDSTIMASEPGTRPGFPAKPEPMCTPGRKMKPRPASPRLSSG